jgi:hypothetical protein
MDRLRPLDSPRRRVLARKTLSLSPREIATLLMVFLIQGAQNKDALAMHVKLNEIIQAVEGASNHIVNAEGLSEATLSRLRESYQQIAENAERRGEPPRARDVPGRTMAGERV